MTKNDLVLIPGNQKLLDDPKSQPKDTVTISRTKPPIKRTLLPNTYSPKNHSNYQVTPTPMQAPKTQPTERKLKLVYSKPSIVILLAALTSLMSGKQVHAQSIFESTPAKGWAVTQVEADKAKKLAKTGKTVTVAVIDTGVDIHHPDLKDSLWVNSGETGVDSFGRDKATNGIDDDGNGYVDDVHGWNFVNRNNNVRDTIDHGTHISGIIASSKGIAPGVAKIMVLKYYNPKASAYENLQNTISAIRYAIKMKAQIINYSAGGLDKSPTEEKAIREALDNKILFVAAAGNEKTNSDIRGFYPADYDLENILSVTAVDPNKKVLESSNYGKNSVDIAAPGQSIYSTLPGGQFGYMSGTSQATAVVSGIAALLISAQPHLTEPKDIIRQLLASGEREASLIGKTKSNSLVNSYRALAMQDQSINAFGEKMENLKNSSGASQDLFYPEKFWKSN